MSRNNKSRRKDKQQRQQRKKLAFRQKTPPTIDVCDHASDLIGRGQWHEAREVLEEYERTRPGQGSVLRLLLDVYHQQRDYGPYCRTCRQLLEKKIRATGSCT